jgi:ADP-ribose pyrophosphatase YjhB (NUDIX family)
MLTVMSSDKNPLTQAEFDAIYAKVPRLSVEVIIRNSNNEGYLTKRDYATGITAACTGQWHLPGGTVRFAEPLITTVRRIAHKELGIEVEAALNTGYIEYPSHYNHGMDSPVGIVFEATKYTGEPTPKSDSKSGGWFSKLPPDMHADQDVFLIQNKYVVA